MGKYDKEWEEFSKNLNILGTDENLMDIAIKCRRIMQDCIQKVVYEAYEPVEYERTYQLIDNVDYKIDGNNLYIFINTGNMHYTSAVDGRNVTKLVPWLIDHTGHMDGTGIRNMYHYYSERKFLEETAKEIKRRLGFEVEIIKTEPPIV